MKRHRLIMVALFLSAAPFTAGCSAGPPAPMRAQEAMSTCSCAPGFHCEMLAEDSTFYCAPDPPPRVYVAAGQACGVFPDEQGVRTDFRCRLDAHCADGICVCTFFPGGQCGPITCPEGTFCEVDVYGTFYCGRFAGDCP